MKYKIVKGDLLHMNEPVDAIVNSANRFMSKGGGICGKIHEAAGYEFTEYCRKQGYLSVGECKTTPGFLLESPYVIHVLTPVFGRHTDAEMILVQTYQNVFKEAERMGFNKIGIPLLGGGHHFYPEGVALSCAKQAMKEYESEVLEVILVLY